MDKSYKCIIKSDGHSPDREAFFQRWGDAIIYDEGHNPYTYTCAVVVEVSTGIVHVLRPNEIRFC